MTHHDQQMLPTKTGEQPHGLPAAHAAAQEIAR